MCFWGVVFFTYVIFTSPEFELNMNSTLVVQMIAAGVLGGMVVSRLNEGQSLMKLGAENIGRPCLNKMGSMYKEPCSLEKETAEVDEDRDLYYEHGLLRERVSVPYNLNDRSGRGRNKLVSSYKGPERLRGMYTKKKGAKYGAESKENIDVEPETGSYRVFAEEPHEEPLFYSSSPKDMGLTGGNLTSAETHQTTTCSLCHTSSLNCPA